jgi:DNA-binding transcriptional MerR regulator
MPWHREGALVAWSTREIAELAGTTLRTVRHYHALGLLPEPEREANGYKAYRTEHLVRLLEIRRFTRLGFSLQSIESMESDPSNFVERLEAIDADLADSIQRLTATREEIRLLRSEPTKPDLPHGLSAAATKAHLSSTDRSLFAVLSHMTGEGADTHWQAMLEDYDPDDAAVEFDSLPEDADEATREALAQRMAPQSMALSENHPRPAALANQPRGKTQRVGETVISAMLELYNPAQLDVLARIWRIAGFVD